jgi:DNA-binding MarR family transcriptional regulator
MNEDPVGSTEPDGSAMPGTAGRSARSGAPGSPGGMSGLVERAGFVYLLVQLGHRAARLFSEQLAPLGLEPRHAGMLVRLGENEGRSQQAIGELIGLNPTRMVFLVAELEQRGLVERRRSDADRRSNALYLTDAGREALSKIGTAVAAQRARLGYSLSTVERDQLTGLLQRLADEQGITEQTLPGGHS